MTRKGESSENENVFSSGQLERIADAKAVKGHGFGVKDIQATDRNQAVIIHTATGHHRQELAALFADLLQDQDEDADDDE